jgi:CRP/FNR family transcriptional regulator, anaerobic regulatory protein
MKLKDFITRVGSFSQDEFADGLKYFRMETYAKGDFYLQEGQQSNSISFVETGLFRLFYQIEAEEKIMLFFTENQFMTDYFGFLTQTPSKRPIQALEDSVVYTINRDQLERLYRSSKNWERTGRILAEAAYITSVLRANRLLHDDYDTRLKTFLIENPSLMQRIPQYMIASYLNMTPETLSRVKRRIFGKDGIKETIHQNI